MTIQDLKNNRNEIIAEITEKVGEDNVKSVMEIMVQGVDCCDSVEELIESSLSIFEQKQTAPIRKAGKLATMIGKFKNDNNIRYNSFTKEYEKF